MFCPHANKTFVPFALPMYKLEWYEPVNLFTVPATQGAVAKDGKNCVLYSDCLKWSSDSNKDI